MRMLILASMLLLCSACTTLKPTEINPEQLRQEISSGELIEVGDKIKIVTVDGKRHEFKVTEVTQDVIKGDDMTVAISDVHAIEIREFSGKKTAAAAVGGYVLVSVISALVFLATLGGI